MSKIEDGGPAFPEAIAIGPAGDVYPGFGGMTLRDWFAGQALAGMGTWCPDPSALPNGSAGLKARALWAYAQADAMLAARKEPA